MPSTFFGINIATSGMATYNAGLVTTGHNISNLGTKGYTRQYVTQKAKDAISLRTSFGMLGSGVEATSILNSRSNYYDSKYRKINSTYGKYAVENYYIKNIQDYFYPAEESSGSVYNSLTSFFTSLDLLSTSNLDTTIRSSVTGYADTLAYYVEQTAIQLQELQREANTQIAATIQQINSYAAQIASLTKQINTIEVYGDPANDLRDQRAYIIDQLSELANITVTEKAPEDNNGTVQYIVTLGEGILVDTTKYNTINYKSAQNKVSQNDVDNLYELEWSYGQEFDSHSPILGGRLQGLFEIRDGNNGDNFRATLVGLCDADGNSIGDSTGAPGTLTMRTDAFSSVTARDLAQLDIPSSGVITVGRREYEYESFEVEVAADGTYTYTFQLKNYDQLADGEWTYLETVQKDPDIERRSATVGDSIDFRGIPYYMRELNEFIRTFSANFNMVQNQGYDGYGNLGRDLFVATGITSGEEYDMTEFLFNSEDKFYYFNGYKVFDEAKWDAYGEDGLGYTFVEVTITNEDGDEEVLPGYYYMYAPGVNPNDPDAPCEKVYRPADVADDDNEDFQFANTIFKFYSTPQDGKQACYYAMTALTFAAAADLVADGQLLACSATHSALDPESGAGGWEEGNNLKKMIAMCSDNSMFKQGDPQSFLNVLITATLGVDAERIEKSAANSENLLYSVDHHRMSESGVDEDEEGENLIIYQNLLTYQYRVLSVMNEVLDKLINGTAV